MLVVNTTAPNVFQSLASHLRKGASTVSSATNVKASSFWEVQVSRLPTLLTLFNSGAGLLAVGWVSILFLQTAFISNRPFETFHVSNCRLGK